MAAGRIRTILPYLQKLASSGDEQVADREPQLLGKNQPLSAERQRDVRAVRVLEQAATPEARKLLQALTSDSPGWWVTQEATAALERLKQREKK